VVSTHDLGDAAAADHLLLLAGRVVASGPPDAVLTPEHLAAAYGGHLLRVGEQTLILDDHPHH
jgi:iron complex transport system ATP-binding protein